jgi:ADP-heptose:LPS heptosyltransferase
LARILVVKLGALGDVVLAFSPFAAIRAHHPRDEVTLLTRAPFAALCAASPWFDAVEIDHAPAWWDLRGVARLRRFLRGFDFVYDLQTSGRSSRYFRLATGPAGRPGWSGIARGASHPHDNPDRDRMHTRERQAEQLAQAGIADVPFAGLSWLAAFGPVLEAPYALLVPGAAPHRPAKRWPAERFGELAALLSRRCIRPVVVGSAADAPLAATILRQCPAALDLTGRTSLLELGGIASRAALAVGNDTGPMHLAAAMGSRAIVLFSRESDPALTAPRGPDPALVTVLRVGDLAALGVDRVAALLG